MQSTSPFGDLDWVDIYKGVRGALIVFVGAFLVAGWDGINYMLETGDLNLSFLEFTRPALIAGASFVGEELRRIFRAYD